MKGLTNECRPTQSINRYSDMILRAGFVNIPTDYGSNVPSIPGQEPLF